MAKFNGIVGYGIDVNTGSGVWEESIKEVRYKGEIIRRSMRVQNSGAVNDNLNMSIQISIIADDFANTNFSTIKYVCYRGARWKVTNVEPQYPRLILTIGEVYNGEHGPWTVE